MANQTKNYRKFVATSVTAALVASAVAPAAFAAEKVDFKDSIPTWAKDAVDYLVGKDAIKGYPDGTFNQAGKLTRAEAAKVLALSLDLKIDEDAKTDFADAKDHWASSYIAAIQKEKPGVINGYNGKFNPNDHITRQEMAKMVVVAYDLKLDEAADISFSDNTGWGAKEVSILASLGVVEGVSAGKFSPNADVTRGQAAVFVHRTEVDSVRVAVPSKEAKVTSVAAINATQVQITFNKAVDTKTLFVNGESGALASGVLSFRSIDGLTDGTFTGELSEDGKVLIVTSTQLLEKRYDVTLDKVKTLSGDAFEKYSQIVTIAKDVTAPTLNGVDRITASQVKIKFSEPMASAGSTTFRLSDGTLVTNITGQGSLVDGGKAVILDLSHIDIPVNKDITATIIGAADKAGNLLTPNPATVTFQKGAKDGVAPTVSTITQSGAKTFEIQFSEVIVGKPTVAIDNVNVNPNDVVINAKDATKVTVTAPAVLNGEKIITVSGAVDGSGEVGNTTNRVVKFVKDDVAPKVVSTQVVADSTDKAEYLEITFDKNVALNASTIDVTGGSFVKDYVTTNLLDADITVQSLTYKNATDKKVVRVKLSTLLGTKDIEGAKYSVDLAFANVSSEFGVGITTGSATFTRGKDGVLANTDVQVLSTVTKGIDNNKVIVTFVSDVDPASATIVGNYIVGGAVVESATVSSTNLKQVTLTLAANSNTFTGFRNVTVQNVKAAGSTVTMTTTTKAVELNENVAPTVTAQLQSDLKTIKLTFSENVYQTSNLTNDFGLFVGTDAYMYDHDDNVATPDIAFVTDSGLTTVDSTAKSTINIVLPSTVTASQLTKGLSLKALTGIDIKDTAGNSLSVSGNIAISNN